MESAFSTPPPFCLIRSICVWPAVSIFVTLAAVFCFRSFDACCALFRSVSNPVLIWSAFWTRFCMVVMFSPDVLILASSFVLASPAAVTSASRLLSACPAAVISASRLCFAFPAAVVSASSVSAAVLAAVVSASSVLAAVLAAVMSASNVCTVFVAAVFFSPRLLSREVAVVFFFSRFSASAVPVFILAARSFWTSFACCKLLLNACCICWFFVTSALIDFCAAWMSAFV